MGAVNEKAKTSDSEKFQKSDDEKKKEDKRKKENVKGNWVERRFLEQPRLFYRSYNTGLKANLILKKLPLVSYES